jgi:hypothetical protein
MEGGNRDYNVDNDGLSIGQKLGEGRVGWLLAKLERRRRRRD